MLAVKANCLPINGQLQGALPCATTCFVTRTPSTALCVGLRSSCHFFGQARCRSQRNQLRQGAFQLWSTVCQQQAQVVVTREAGKNGKLKSALQKQGISVLELPLVETGPGPDRDQLANELRKAAFAWVVITSPEAANVFLQGWRDAGKPQVRIAVVGQGTGQVIEAHQEPLLHIGYTPPKANAVSLSAGLPHIEGGSQRVLYPSSAKAGSDLQTGLMQRDFEVIRLNTYDTRPVSQVESCQLKQACEANVVAFASPSAVKAWQQLTKHQDVGSIAVACIGSTTAIAAQKQGFRHVYFPEQPGMDGFVVSITDALKGYPGRVLTA